MMMSEEHYVWYDTCICIYTWKLYMRQHGLHNMAECVLMRVCTYMHSWNYLIENLYGHHCITILLSSCIKCKNFHWTHIQHITKKYKYTTMMPMPCIDAKFIFIFASVCPCIICIFWCICIIVLYILFLFVGFSHNCGLIKFNFFVDFSIKLFHLLCRYIFVFY